VFHVRGQVEDRQMKNRLTALFTLVMVFLFPCSPLLGQNYTVVMEKGMIDWSNGIAEAVGTGTPPPDPENKAQARAVAEKEAVLCARQNLLDLLRDLRIDSAACIKDLLAEGSLALRELEGYVQQSRVVETSYREEGLVQATVAMKLWGPFIDRILPESIRPIRPVKQPKPPGQEKGEGYSGLVLDCRGLIVKPAIAPRIVDEDGKEVYGFAYASREHAVEQGMAGYVTTLETAQSSQRVAGSPLTVKAIRTADWGLSDIVISNSDADHIRRAASNLGFLQKCRVVIVLDM